MQTYRPNIPISYQTTERLRIIAENEGMTLASLVTELLMIGLNQKLETTATENTVESSGRS